MATLEFLQNRISGKQKELEKLEKKMERILKAQSTNWEVNPYYYRESDIKWTQKDIDQARQSLINYQEQYSEEVEKSNSRNVQAVLDFLQDWKDRVRTWYVEGLTAFYQDFDKVKVLAKVANSYEYCTDEWQEAWDIYTEFSKAFRQKCKGYFRPLTPEEQERENKKSRWNRKDSIKIKDGEYEPYKQYTGFRSFSEAMERLDKDLEAEANRKYDDIIERTNKIVGQITDASNLRVGAKGDLNGFIIGTRGKASVTTIGAGGYNIQCYHFRTLIKSL